MRENPTEMEKGKSQELVWTNKKAENMALTNRFWAETKEKQNL